MNHFSKKHKTGIRILIGLAAFLLVCCAAFGIYLSGYHVPSEAALERISEPSDGVSTIVDKKTIAFVPDDDIIAGVVFYPGMKIRGAAYAEIADTLAENGYLCVLVNMPLNMSVLDSDAALSVISAWPDVSTWYIGGHSMGGQSAQKCVLDNPGVFSGLITVARQLDFDFSGSDIPILGIYGSEDGICDLKDAAGNRSRTNADDYTEIILEGGCHGYFGDYGRQRWDGTPTITREEQLQDTALAILDFMNRTEEEK